MNSPADRLNRFEAKYGSYTEILNQYVDAKHKESAWHPGGYQRETTESRRLDRLLKTHNELVHAYMGAAHVHSVLDKLPNWISKGTVTLILEDI